MPRSLNSSLIKPLVVLAFPGMYLVYKISEFKRQQQEQNRRKVTERELAHLNHKIDKLLTKLDEHEPELANTQDEECVICISAKATMQTFPCGHRVVCRKCFVKTIQMAVSQRILPLRCVICRAKIIRLKQSSHGRATPVGPHMARTSLLSPCEVLAGGARPPFLTPKDFEGDVPAIPGNHYRNSATACHRHCHRREGSHHDLMSPMPSRVDETVESPQPLLPHPLMYSKDNEEDQPKESLQLHKLPRPTVQRLDPSQIQVHPEPTERRTLIHPPPVPPRRPGVLLSPITPTSVAQKLDTVRASSTSPTTSLPSPPTSNCPPPEPLSPSSRFSQLSSPTRQDTPTPSKLSKPKRQTVLQRLGNKEAFQIEEHENTRSKVNTVPQPAILLPPPPTSTEVRKKHHRVSPSGCVRGHLPSRFERFKDMHVRRPIPLFPIPEKEEVELLDGAFCRVPPGTSDYLIRTSSPKISVVQDRVPLLQMEREQHSPSLRSQLKSKMAGFPSLLSSRSPLRVFRGGAKHKKVADVK